MWLKTSELSYNTYNTNNTEKKSFCFLAWKGAFCKSFAAPPLKRQRRWRGGHEGQRRGEHRLRGGKSGRGARNLAALHSNSRNPRKKIPFFSLQDPKSWINPQQDNGALQTALWLYGDLHLWELSKPAFFHVLLSDRGQRWVLWKWQRPISC